MEFLPGGFSARLVPSSPFGLDSASASHFTSSYAIGKHVGISTTHTLEGWEIEQYLGPIVVHTVAGSGLISDWFASWSDVFGGRSGAYGSQLRSLSDEALQSLRARAAGLKANWVIGMTVDMDEVSGQGKQMFMVTAMGTAVVARPIRNAEPGTPSSAAHLSAEQVRAAERRFRLLDSIGEGPVEFTEATWDTLLQERISEAVPHVIGEMERSSMYGGNPENVKSRAVMFLQRLEPSDASRQLYALARGDSARARLAIDLIKQLNLRDLNIIYGLLKSESRQDRVTALQLLPAQQLTYDPSDAAQLRTIAAICEDPEQFPVLVKQVPGKAGLFGAADRVECVCGESRVATKERCENFNCGRETRGFREREVTPEKARDLCLAQAAVLDRAFLEAGVQAATA